MTTSSPEAVCVTRRGLEAHQIAVSARIGAVPLVVSHTAGSFADAVNRALQLASNPVVLKVDDHDEYPTDHASILDEWKPGLVLYGRADFVGCDGQQLGRWATLCASAFPSDIRVTGDRHGAVTQSVLTQCQIREVETGVRKLICPGDWSWGTRPGSFRKVECAHA
jgi:hypothetical protein